VLSGGYLNRRQSPGYEGIGVDLEPCGQRPSLSPGDPRFPLRTSDTTEGLPKIVEQVALAQAGLFHDGPEDLIRAQAVIS